tara:strand:- start:14729 stop:15427 length:699 start_codon:yes stop_codon:yes gene_type:complete
MRKKVIRYGLEFLVVFSGILLSFVIDNRIKVNERIANKDLLLNQLTVALNEDRIQLEVVKSALDNCLVSIDSLLENHSKRNMSSKRVALNFSNVSARMSISFFPQKSIYNQLINSSGFELIENEKLKKGLTDYYEHLSERNNSINIKLDQFNQEFDYYFIPHINYVTSLNQLDNSVDLSSSISIYTIHDSFYQNASLGYLTNAQKRIVFYQELLKKYEETLDQVFDELGDNN